MGVLHVAVGAVAAGLHAAVGIHRVDALAALRDLAARGGQAALGEGEAASGSK